MQYKLKVSKTYLLQLALPIFFANIAIPFVGIVDTGLMGNLGNEKFLTAISISTSVITMILWSFGFLRMGTVGLVAQSFGKSDYREIVLTVSRNISIAVLISILIILSKDYIILLIERYFSTSSETQTLIANYISVRILSAPAELIIYVLIGLFIGLQRTKISSLLVIFFSITNIILSIYFVRDLNLDIYGVALGTVLSAYLTVFIFLIFSYFYIKNEFKIVPRFRKVFITRKIFKLFNINFDIFIRTLLLTFAFLWFTYQGSKLGEDYLAANAILLQFVILASFFLDSYAFATEGLIGFIIGRKAKKSFLLTISNSFKLSFFTGIIISVIYIFFFKYIISILTDSDSLRFITYDFIFWVIMIPPIASFCYQFDGIFVGASQTSEMRNCMLISVILYILFTYFCVYFLKNHGLWLSLLFFMIIRSVTLNFFLPKILRRF
tara:strand:+ start:222 stop:1538 length:1317 start_codon:yes stop_codon:yes gene_type:complete